MYDDELLITRQSLLFLSANRGFNACHVTLGKRPVGFVHISVTCMTRLVSCGFFWRRVLQTTNENEENVLS